MYLNPVPGGVLSTGNVMVAEKLSSVLRKTTLSRLGQPFCVSLPQARMGHGPQTPPSLAEYLSACSRKDLTLF